MKKKGLELSINFLIVIILSMALLFMGALFFKNLLSGANKIKENYDQQTAEELELLLTQGERVAIPYTRQDVRRGDTVVFGLGIYNALGENYNFKVDVQCSSAFEGTAEIIGACNIFDEGGIVYNTMDLPIKNNDRHTMPIAIYFSNDAESATYAFNVCVCYKDSTPVTCPECISANFPIPSDILYDSVHKMYATVK